MVHAPVALHDGLALKLRRYHHELKVALGGRAAMHVALVDHLQHLLGVNTIFHNNKKQEGIGLMIAARR
jgi:hypothetical protein